MRNILDRYSNLLSAVLLLALGLFMLLGAIDIVPVFEGIGADIVPKAVSAGLLLIGALLVPAGIKELKAPQEEIAAKEAREDEQITDDDGVKVVIPEYRLKLAKFGVPLSMALFLAYCLLMKPVGFIVSTVIYMFLQALLLSLKVKRNMISIIIMSVVTPIIIYLIFGKLFSVVLPMGILSFLS